MSEFVIGPRQTVDRVRLCGAMGQLVWNNGPAFFVPEDGGTPLALRSVSWGGVSANRTPTSWRVVALHSGERVEADIYTTGEDHSRWYSPIFGDGWLVSESTGWRYRFESLDGDLKARFEIASMCVGRPAYRAAMQRKHTRSPLIDDPDEMNWTTYETSEGDLLAFRRRGPRPDGFIAVDQSTYKLLTPKARKAYDAAKAAHEAAVGAER